ncbi:MAG: flagellar basal body P-ring formation chaperone FlgA [Candidatus Latescibacterota bacterium]|nr:flagellar basal body P-ring formation chaperone FlgA [Candidatus Latescibacterota bacterium]
MIAATVIIAALAGFVAAAFADTDSHDGTLSVISEGLIHSVVEAHVLGRLEEEADSEKRGEIRYQVRTRWQGDILLDEPGRVQFDIHQLTSRPLRGPSVLRVDIQVDGRVEHTITLTADCRLYQDVVVTTRTMRRGGSFAQDVIEIAERDVTSQRHGFYTSLHQLEGMRSSRPIGLGDVVTHRHAQPIPIVHRGDAVAMLVRSQNMVLTTEGVALQDGGIGEKIRVRNADSGKVVYGEIADAGTVQIGG